MPDLSVTIAGTTGTGTFTSAQAEKFIPPLLRRHGWQGETVWGSMTAQEKQDVLDFLAQLLLHEAAVAARKQTATEGSDDGEETATNDYDGVVDDLLVKPPV